MKRHATSGRRQLKVNTFVGLSFSPRFLWPKMLHLCVCHFIEKNYYICVFNNFLWHKVSHLCVCYFRCIFLLHKLSHLYIHPSCLISFLTLIFSQQHVSFVCFYYFLFYFLNILMEIFASFRINQFLHFVHIYFLFLFLFLLFSITHQNWYMPSLTFYFCWQKMDQSNWQTFNQL